MRRKIESVAPYILLAAALLLLLLLNLFYQRNWLDSDMAAEMLFSKLLAEEGRLVATPDWYYSTEFRVLYTQLIMVPLFHLTDNWHVIRTVTNLLFYIFLLASYYYFMKPFRVKRSLVVLTSAVLLLPFSETMMTHVQIGNTYMPHMIIVFLFFGMFLRLAAGGISRARRVELMCFYLLLAVICGMSGVRYLLVLQCPLVLAAFLCLFGSKEFKAFRRLPCMEGIQAAAKAPESRFLFYSLAGLLGSLAGYGVNVSVISKRYVFQTYGATNFIPIYQGELFDRIQNAVGCLLMLFGYIPEKGVLSLRGLVTVAAFAMLALLTLCAVKALRDTEGIRHFTCLFLITAFCVNFFVFCFTTSTMVPRYYLTIFIFTLPAFCFYQEGRHLKFDRTVVSVLLAGCLLLGTVKVVASFVTVDKNESKYGVAAFLRENDYEFGFATYWNANIITELTDGAVEIANIGDPEYLEYFTWSSPMKYYTEDYAQGEVFLLLTAEEEARFGDTRAVKTGEKIYSDGSYCVYLYDSADELLSCAEKR